MFKLTSRASKMDVDHLDVAVITRGKNGINTVRFLTQTAPFVS